MKKSKKSKKMAKNHPVVPKEMAESSVVLPQVMDENVPNLPEEMLVEIFSRLPTKSVGRCRCLSRFWRARLSNPDFINLHKTRRPHEENHLILITADNPIYEGGHRINPIIADSGCSIYTMDFPITADEGLLKPLHVSKKNCVDVVGSVNGLVLLLDKFGQFFLVNPVTTEKVTIPNVPFNIYMHDGDVVHGFGYDSSSDDYKIVTIGYDRVCAVFVYSLKRGTWVRKGNLPSPFRPVYRRSAALVKGALHWLCADKDWFKPGKQHYEYPAVVAFDLVTEEFHLITAPNYPNYCGKHRAGCNAFALEGCLGIVGVLWDAWVMKEYGSQESWTKLSLCDTRSHLSRSLTFAKPLCYIEKDQVVVVDLSMKELVLSNLKEERTTKVMLRDKSVVTHASKKGDEFVVTDACVFVESLVSPKQLASLN